MHRSPIRHAYFVDFTACVLTTNAATSTWETAALIYSDSAGILTQDLQNRNLTLYTAKLRSQR